MFLEKSTSEARALPQGLQTSTSEERSRKGFISDELAFLKPESGLSDEECIRVARNCPSRAISVFDSEGNEIPT